MVEAVSEILTNTKLNSNSVSVNKNINNTKTLNTLPRTVSQVRLIANKIATELNNQSRLKYYYKIAWKLPESVIWNNLEQAKTGRNPQRYFSWLCQQSLN